VSRIEHIRLMAKYNAWMNTKIYEAILQLPKGELAANKKAPFGSMLGISSVRLKVEQI